MKDTLGAKTVTTIRSCQPTTLVGITVAAFLCFLILHFSNGMAPLPNMDQGFVYIDPWPHQINGHWKIEYPHLEYAGGITATLLVSLYKLAIPTADATLNYHVKLFVAALYLLSVIGLIREYLQSTVEQISALLIIGSSGLVVLEPSSEIISAVYFNIFLISISRAWIIPAAIGLALFSLTKAEMVPIGIAAAACWLFVGSAAPRHKLIFIFVFAAVELMLLAPSWLLYGWPGSRSFPAIELTYCSWYAQDVQSCAAGRFVSIGSLQELIWSRPRQYFDFLLWRLPNVGSTIAGVLGPIAILPILIAFGWSRLTSPGRRVLVAITTVTLLATIAVALAVGLMVPRYLTRAYPAAVIACLICWHAMTSTPVDTDRRVTATGSVVFAVVAVLLNLYWLPSYLSAPHSF